MEVVIGRAGATAGAGAEASEPVAPLHPSLSWTSELVTGHAGMDETHRSFVMVTSALLTASDAELLGRLRDFEAHARTHFDEEDALMRGSAYPSAGCHVDEHAAVLKSVAEVIHDVAAGKLGIGRHLAAELARWFPAHTEHMDKSLAAWLFGQSTGAARLVFRPGTRANVDRKTAPPAP